MVGKRTELTVTFVCRPPISSSGIGPTGKTTTDVRESNVAARGIKAQGRGGNGDRVRVMIRSG